MKDKRDTALRKAYELMFAAYICQVPKSWEILGTLYTKRLIVTKTYKILVLQLHLQA